MGFVGACGCCWGQGSEDLGPQPSSWPGILRPPVTGALCYAWPGDVAAWKHLGSLYCVLVFRDKIQVGVSHVFCDTITGEV